MSLNFKFYLINLTENRSLNKSDKSEQKSEFLKFIPMNAKEDEGNF